MELIQRKIPVRITQSKKDETRVTHTLFCENRMFCQAKNFFEMKDAARLFGGWKMLPISPEFENFFETLLAFYRNTTSTELPFAKEKIKSITAFTGIYPASYNFHFDYEEEGRKKELILTFEDWIMAVFDDAEWLNNSGWHEAAGVKL